MCSNTQKGSIVCPGIFPNCGSPSHHQLNRSIRNSLVQNNFIFPNHSKLLQIRPLGSLLGLLPALHSQTARSCCQIRRYSRGKKQIQNTYGVLLDLQKKVSSESDVLAFADAALSLHFCIFGAAIFFPQFTNSFNFGCISRLVLVQFMFLSLLLLPASVHSDLLAYLCAATDSHSCVDSQTGVFEDGTGDWAVGAELYATWQYVGSIDRYLFCYFLPV